jgi:hypothetical protein
VVLAGVLGVLVLGVLVLDVESVFSLDVVEVEDVSLSAFDSAFDRASARESVR